MQYISAPIVAVTIDPTGMRRRSSALSLTINTVDQRTS